MGDELTTEDAHGTRLGEQLVCARSAEGIPIDRNITLDLLCRYERARGHLNGLKDASVIAGELFPFSVAKTEAELRAILSESSDAGLTPGHRQGV